MKILSEKALTALVDATNCHHRPPSVGMPFDDVCRIHPTDARASLDEYIGHLHTGIGL